MSDSPPDGLTIRKLIRGLSQLEGAARPDLVVMTTKACGRLLDARRLDPTFEPPKSGSDSDIRVFGIPVEHYPTMRECMDRLVDRGGPRIRSGALILDGPVPDELQNHPFMLSQRSPILNWLEREFGFRGSDPA